MSQRNQVKVIVTFRFRKKVTSDTLATITRFVKETRKSLGCERFDLLRNLDDPQSFSLVETWENIMTHDLYLSTQSFKEHATYLSINTCGLNVTLYKDVNID